MSFLGNLLYHTYYKHRPDKKVIENYGGKIRYNEMLLAEKEMRHFALNSLQIDKPFNKDGKYKLNFLTGEKFIHQTLFCLYSFSRFLTADEAENFSVTFFDDNSLKQTTLQLLSDKFPNITFTDFKTSSRRLEAKFPPHKFPYIIKKNRTVVLFNKIFFPHIQGSGLKIFMDSDMLFFKRPTEFLLWLETKYLEADEAFVIEDIMQSYGYNQKAQEDIAGKPMDNALNVGFYGIHSQKIDFERIESMLRKMDTHYKKTYYAEQFVTAVLLTDLNLQIFPKDQYIVFPTSQDVALEKGTLHHYVDVSKYIYFTQSWKKVIKESSIVDSSELFV